jgi:predicted O-methyltransferase YrrM
MDTAVKHLLTELEEFGKANDAIQAEKTQRMLNLESQTAALIHLLIRLGRCKNVLEIGTSNGYSTIWIADVLRETDIDGNLTSIDINPGKIEMARVNVGRAGFIERDIYRWRCRKLLVTSTGPLTVSSLTPTVLAPKKS